VFFEWDVDKARKNLAKHGASFDEAITVFGDPLAVTIHDPDHSDDEERLRIINAREVTPAESKQYESGE
jgi:uncharacterized DUF497 family protein